MELDMRTRDELGFPYKYIRETSSSPITQVGSHWETAVC